MIPSCEGRDAANPTLINISVSDGSTKSITNTYTNDTTNWHLGLLTQTVVNSVVGSSNLTRTSSFGYQATTGLLNQEIIEPSDTPHKLQTDYTLDAYGNRTAITVSGSGITTRTSNIGYDTKGEFATSTTNALSQSESFAYDARFGTVTSHTDLNSLVTSWTYDSFGRVTQETRPDNTKTQTIYSYCSGINGGSASCATAEAFLVQVKEWDTSGAVQNGPTGTTRFDMLTRVTNNQTQSFAGVDVFVPRTYDSSMCLASVSRPTISGGTYHWTTYTNDALCRPTLATMPDSSHTTYAYHGLTTSVTNDKSQTTTTVRNAQGQTASVTDANSKVTAYVYDAFNDLTKITDSAGNVTTNVYDIRGNKTDSTDADMGHWVYGYDVLGELTSQTDAKSQNTTLTYDLLGRLTQKVEPDVTNRWSYDTGTKGIGKLASACSGTGCTSTANSTYFRAHTYDTLGRPSSVAITYPAGTTATYTAAYGSTTGKLSTLTYPDGLVVLNVYNSTGYLSQLKDNGSGASLWTINTRDAEQHPTSQTMGNGVGITQAFDANTGLVQTIQAGTSNSVANFSYTFDTIGNLTARNDIINSVQENFCYDVLNRLTNYSVNLATCSTSGSKSAGYDDLGNITSKSDVGTYSYPASGSSSVRPHAVSSIAGTVGGVVNPAYTYDANGNLICVSAVVGNCLVPAKAITYTAANMISLMVQGTTTVALSYDPEHSRIQQIEPSGTTTYLNDPMTGAFAELFAGTTGGTWSHDFLTVDGKFVAERFKQNTTINWNYFVNNHISSVSVVTDGSGTVTERDSYDAWGMRRNANGTDAPACNLTSVTKRGFTNQEMIDAVCLVNLNARVYDPVIGRFLTPDPVLSRPYDMQGLNGYTYVQNRPLTLVDLTGMMATVVVSDGGSVSVTLPIYFKNETSDPNVVASAIQSIQSSWSGTKGQYSVTTTVVQMSAEEFSKASFGNSVTITDTPTPTTTTPEGHDHANLGHSYVSGDFEGHWTTMDTKKIAIPIPNSDKMGFSPKVSDTFAHEGGHLMNVPDKEGNHGDLMDHGPGRLVTPADIEDVIKSSGNNVSFCSGGKCSPSAPGNGTLQAPAQGPQTQNAPVSSSSNSSKADGPVGPGIYTLLLP